MVIAIVFLVVCGLALSYLLIPSSFEVAEINLRAGRFAAAKTFFSNQYQQGIRSPGVLVALSKIDENDGDIGSAIQRIEELLQTHPNDLFGLKQLADLYRSNQQYDLFYQVLLKIRSIQADAAVLQDLTGWYYDANEPEPLFYALIELVKTGKAEASQLFDLAYFYGQRKEFEQAYEVLEALRRAFPKTMTVSDLLFEVWVMDHIEGKQGEAQIDLIAAYLKQRKNVEEGISALQFFYDRYPSQTPLLIEKVDRFYRDNPIFETNALSILWDQSIHQDEVFQELISLYKRSKCPNSELQNLLFRIYVEKGCDAELLQLDIKQIDARQITDLTIQAIQKQKICLAQQVEKKLGDAYLKRHPAIAIGLALAAQERGAVQRLDRAIEETSLTQAEKISLLQIAAAANLTPQGLAIGCKLVPYIGLNLDQLLSIAHAYVSMKRGDALYALIECAIPTKGAGLLAWLDLSLNRPEQAAQWLWEQTTVPEIILIELYDKAEELHEYPFALFAAKKRRALYPSMAADADYGVALIQVGQIEEGLAILQASKNRRAYFNGLVVAAGQDPAYRTRLYDEMKRRKVKSLHCDELRDFALAYQDVLFDYPAAEKLLWHLAQHQSPNSDDVQALIYLWGPDLKSREKIDWLIQKTEQACPSDFSFWLQHLLYAGQTDRVIEVYRTYAGNRPECDRACSVVSYPFAYLDALSQKKWKPELRQAIEEALPHMQTVSDFETLSAYAGDIESSHLQEEIWQRALELYPDDLTVLQQYADAQFNQHHYTNAAYAFERLFRLYPDGENLYTSRYAYGITLRHLHRYSEGNCILKQALAEIDELCEPPFSARVIRAEIIYTLNVQSRDAIGELRCLYELSGHDSDATADYVNMLMNTGSLREAAAVLRGRCCE
ncbi:MAG: hypothetical protein KGQ49_00305 [Verrucomicrobia bacterium]|nr:hypothetical protein [Verrucomicrobiota bacterium]MBU6445821.1 hypothetical protein [Verrucomicrobiota bacterium]MDE3047516.1 hypothetical protein [Verrucomicrobiota bacterium]